MINTRSKSFKRRGLLDQGKTLIPTRMVISYRFVSSEFSDTDYPLPIVSGYGILRQNTITPSYQKPVLLNENQTTGVSTDTLMDSKDPTALIGTDYSDYFLECSQEVRFVSEHAITGFICKIKGIEHIAHIREIILFGRFETLDKEQEFKIV